MTVDTMCSSSITAIHLACQSLQRGECEVSIAGGVNVSIHPNKYLYLSQGKFISSRGRCESFGEGAEGYVPGEGVGAVLLKPLSQAVEDRDQIYGIIKATAINHGGKTNGYTVPNPKAQASVIGRAFKKAGIEPRAISYMEAHGTGTSLGDPIEIAGLNSIFQEYTDDKQFCALGSAKSNIGHCESAAGIAGLTKVLLQLKYKHVSSFAPFPRTESQHRFYRYAVCRSAGSCRLEKTRVRDRWRTEGIPENSGRIVLRCGRVECPYRCRRIYPNIRKIFANHSR